MTNAKHRMHRRHFIRSMLALTSIGISPSSLFQHSGGTSTGSQTGTRLVDKIHDKYRYEMLACSQEELYKIASTIWKNIHSNSKNKDEQGNS